MQSELLRHPLALIAAVWLLIAGALVREVPAQALLVMSASSEPGWHFEKYYPGSWAVTPTLIVLALCLLRGFAWSRYSVLILVPLLLVGQWSFGLAPKHGNFPFAALQEALSSTLLVVATALLVVPSVRMWFGRSGARGDA
jgi:hypothetical protein